MFISKSLRIILIGIVIGSLFVLCIFGTVYMEWTYGFFGYEWDGFKNKEQVINAVKDNFNDLILLTNEMYDKYNDTDKHLYTCYIDNKMFKFNNGYSYKTTLSNKIFKKLRIDYVAINYDSNCRKHSVKYVVKNKFGDECGFYYSFDDDKNYETIIKEHLQKTMSYIELATKTAFLSQMKSGWYTEKICDNWYFFENDFDNLNFIKYIYDDIINVATMSEYHQKHKQSLKKYNPHMNN